jgi:imidazolonepropionase-like amidohydrolase/Tol biopolymer transport system component
MLKKKQQDMFHYASGRFYLATLAILCSLTLGAQEKKEDKWDVNAPKILDYQEHSFRVTEGTWMNVDLSPDGRTIAFDLLGDIYTMPVAGGEAMAIRQGIAWEIQPRWSPDGQTILFTSDAGGGDNTWTMAADGTKAKQITKETFRLLNNPTWMPDGQYFIARKHFTSTRSAGAGEMMLYHINGGDGVQLTKRKNDQQDLNEPVVSPDGKTLYYSEDLYPGGFFQYNKNPNAQIFAIKAYDFERGTTRVVTGGSGGAMRPQISRDGRWLSFVRRVDTKTTLFLHHLATAEEFQIYDKLDKDQQEAWTIFGCYPNYTWTTTHDGILIWAGGQIKKIALGASGDALLTALRQGGRVGAEVDVKFAVGVKTKLAETVRSAQKVHEDQFTVRAIRGVRTSPDGKFLVFNAAGYLYRKDLPNGTPKRLTTGSDFEFEPSFSRDGKRLVYVTWNDKDLGGVHIYDFGRGSSSRVAAARMVNGKSEVERGIFRNPSFSPDGRSIVLSKEEGNDEMGYAFCTQPGIYTMASDGADVKRISEDGEMPQYSHDGKRIYYATGGYLFGALDKTMASMDLNGQDKRTIFKSKYANQWLPSPDGKWLAFTELHKAYVVAMPMSGKEIDLSGDSKTMPVAQISRDAGYNLHWSSDSRNIHWTLGEEYFTTPLNERFAFLPGAPDSLPALDSTGLRMGLTLAADKPMGVTVYTNARIVTMEGDEVIENGTIVVRDNKIENIYAYGKFNSATSPSATVVDCTGKTIMPGIIDAHAHSGNFRYGLSPQKQWQYWANLAFGVTTSHDPSTNSEMVFSHSEMLKSGRMMGPRLFSTGTILYGADGDFKAPINSLDDARAALRRTQAWGAFSVKSYNQPRRDQRQQIMAAAKELNMLVVPEGGSHFSHNMTMVQDGHTGVEHNIPVAPLYSDVIEMWRRTKTHNTPTLIVCYGALNGEYYWYQKTDVWKNERLRRFTPATNLDERSRHRTMIPDAEYENGHILVSKACKKLQDAGVNINLGAHGQLQGLGAHWELWMLQQGGMSNHQALKCATINGARYLGLDAEIGSLKSGKLADFLILDKNPLDDIQHSTSISLVVINGRTLSAETLQPYGMKPATGSGLGFWFERPGSAVNGVKAGVCKEKGGCVCGH